MGYDNAPTDPHHGGKLTYEDWRRDLLIEMAKVIGSEPGTDTDPMDEALRYIEATGEDCWREMYDDGMTPREAVDEDGFDAMWLA